MPQCKGYAKTTGRQCRNFRNNSDYCHLHIIQAPDYDARIDKYKSCTGINHDNKPCGNRQTKVLYCHYHRDQIPAVNIKLKMVKMSNAEWDTFLKTLEYEELAEPKKEEAEAPVKKEKEEKKEAPTLIKKEEAEVLVKKEKEEAKEEMKLRPNLHSIKGKVWDHWVGNVDAVACPICPIYRPGKAVNILHRDDFTGFHIQSHVRGGEASVDNLRPTCAACNLRNGINELPKILFKYSN